MTITQQIKVLSSAENAAFKARSKFVQGDAHNGPQFELIDRIWRELYNACRQMKLAEAERKDRAEVCWSVYQPDPILGTREIIRTPRRICIRYVRGNWTKASWTLADSWRSPEADFAFTMANARAAASRPRAEGGRLRALMALSCLLFVVQGASILAALAAAKRAPKRFTYDFKSCRECGRGRRLRRPCGRTSRLGGKGLPASARRRSA